MTEMNKLINDRLVGPLLNCVLWPCLNYTYIVRFFFSIFTTTKKKKINTFHIANRNIIYRSMRYRYIFYGFSDLIRTLKSATEYNQRYGGTVLPYPEIIFEWEEGGPIAFLL